MLQLVSIIGLEDKGNVSVGVVDVFRVLDQRRSYRRIVILADEEDVSRWAGPL